MSAKEHFWRLIRLLELEGDAEAERLVEQTRQLTGADAERTGNSLVALVVRDEDVALGGRVLLTLSKRDVRQALPWNRLGVGTPVLLSEESAGQASRPGRSKGTAGWRGIVSGRDARTIQVAFDRPPEPESDPATFRLDQSFDEVARRRQRAALEQAARAERGRLAELRDVLISERPLDFREPDGGEPLDDGLNESQRQAVAFALGAADVAVLHGPPGTGKTTAVVELIRRAVRRGEKVLACAPSNLAVDNLLERLVARGERAVRLGHPARVLPVLQRHTLDVLVGEHSDVRLARKLVREAWALRDRAGRYTRAKPAPGARREMRQEARDLIADARRMEAQAVTQILDSADVLCATLTGLDEGLIGGRTFDLAVIDEAAQATEPACWMPLLRSGRVVLAGDHCQLPPTVLAPEAAREGFGKSLMERLVGEHGPGISRLLSVQYRMHGAIMGFSSAEFYDSVLMADASVRTHTLCDLPHVRAGEDAEALTRTPLLFIDTAGAGYDEQTEPDGESRRNPQEAELVLRQVRALLGASVRPQELAVITPYAAQARLLRERLAALGVAEAVEVDTVDGFQGREKEAVVVSLVRSNPQGEVGFLADVRRMNVALTRARRKLIVVGDSATVAAHPFYARLVEYFEKQEAYRTVWEFGDRVP
jgi:superfamily I DNA and/or RNA helicase